MQRNFKCNCKSLKESNGTAVVNCCSLIRFHLDFEYSKLNSQFCGKMAEPASNSRVQEPDSEYVEV